LGDLGVNGKLMRHYFIPITHLKNQPFYPESLKGKVDFSAFSLQGRGEKS
jgi:hypothetical protein